MSELKDILNSKEMTAPKDGTVVEKSEKADEKNKKPEKLSLPLDS
jgi:hypothetical protein